MCVCMYVCMCNFVYVWGQGMSLIVCLTSVPNKNQQNAYENTPVQDLSKVIALQHAV